MLSDNIDTESGCMPGPASASVEAFIKSANSSESLPNHDEIPKDPHLIKCVTGYVIQKHNWIPNGVNRFQLVINKSYYDN